MYIDNRILLPIAAPFILLLMLRALFWIAGAPWTEPGMAAFMSAVIGMAGGGCVCGFLFENGTSIGGFYIGRKPNP